MLGQMSQPPPTDNPHPPTPHPRWKYCPPAGYQRLVLHVAWDGLPYVGWQFQPNADSVQGQLHAAMKQLMPSPDISGVSGIPFPVAAGRTDSGVHAECMPIHWDLPQSTHAQLYNRPHSPHNRLSQMPQRLPRALQNFLPPQISVLSAKTAPAGFHARFSCHARSYIYRLWVARAPHPLWRNRALHWPFGSLDIDAMNEAAQLLLGERDFAAFATQEDRQTVRELLELRVQKCPCPVASASGGELYEVHVMGESFLRHMVRGLVGTLLLVGQGKRPASAVSDIVQSKNRTQAGMNVAAHGLYFVGGAYQWSNAPEPPEPPCSSHNPLQTP